MRVAFFNYYQSNNRGLETFVHELSQHFPQSKIYSSQNPVSQDRSQINILQRLFLDFPSLMIGMWTFSQLLSLLRYNPNFVFALNGGWQVLILRIFTLLHRSKLIVSAQSGPGWDDRFNLFCHPDVFVSLTTPGLEWAKGASFWSNQKFALIPNGVNLEKFTPKGPKLDVPLKKPIILVVAAAEKNKRVEEAIKAVSKLENASLLWVGKGPLEQKLKLIGTKLLGDRFLHLQVPYSAMPKVYRAADLFTLCSQSTEAFGIAYLEALSTNLPVVASDDLSRKEILGNSGTYVKNPSDLDEYKQALNKALNKKWGTIPLKQAQSFSWNHIANQYAKLLQELSISR